MSTQVTARNSDSVMLTVAATHRKGSYFRTFMMWPCSKKERKKPRQMTTVVDYSPNGSEGRSWVLRADIASVRCVICLADRCSYVLVCLTVR